MKLTDLNVGEKGKILQVPLPRLQELGLIIGTPFQIISRGPFGNPIEISFYENYLLIDRKTAMEIEVSPCG